MTARHNKYAEKESVDRVSIGTRLFGEHFWFSPPTWDKSSIHEKDKWIEEPKSHLTSSKMLIKTLVVHTVEIILAAVVIFITSNRVKFVLWQSSLPSPLKENSLKKPFHLFCTKRTLNNITLIPVSAWKVLSRTGAEEQPINTLEQRNRNHLLVI